MFLLKSLLRFTLIVYIWSVSTSIIAQKIMESDTLYANYLGQKEGLLQLNIKGMAIDDLGYLWAGTEDGLHRFNGYDFKGYENNPSDSLTLKDDHVRGLYFTKDTLWIATNTKGITGYVPSKNKFFNILGTGDLSDFNTTYNVFPLSKDYLLFSVKNHALIYNRHNKTIKPIELNKGVLEVFVTDVLPINEYTYWLGSSTSGIIELNLETLKTKQIELAKTKIALHFLKHNNLIYIGAKDGLHIYDPRTKNIEKTDLNKSVNCFFKLNDDAFYIGTETGLYTLNSKEQTITPFVIYTQDNSIFKTLEVNQIISDGKGNIWIATDGDGLIYYNIYQKKFKTIKIALSEYPNIDNISPFQFLKGQDSTLWIGSKYGIIRYKHQTNKFKLYKAPEEPLIYTIAKDKRNTIWAGGFTTGLLKYNASKDIFEKISGLLDEDVVEIIPFDENTLWVCTWAGGIQKFDINNLQFEEILLNSKSINRARTSLLDSKNNVWLGTDNGVYKITKEQKVTRYHAQDSTDQNLTSDRIFSIKEDNDANIWFGTSTGLTKLDIITNTTTKYRKQKGLPNDFIYTVLINNKDIWVSTNYGLSVLNTTTNTFTNYTVNDGLQNNEFNGKAALKDEFGNFYFGGILGVNIFNPNNIIKNPHIPNVYIESVDLFNNPILKNEIFKDTLRFKSDENVITFNYVALNYLNPEKCNYTYKMQGFDSDWRAITKERSTTYTNLDPGTYTFFVKASNDAGIWNETPETLTLIIIPPWYKTLLFKMALGLLLFISVPLFYFYKNRKLKNDNLKLEHTVIERTQEITLKNEDLKKAYKEADKQRKSIQFLMRELTHRVKNNLQIISSLLNIQANNMTDEAAENALKVAKNRILTISHIENKIAAEKESIYIDKFIKDLSNSIIGALSDDEHLKFIVVYNLDNIEVKNINTTMIGLILNELITNTTKYAFDKYSDNNQLHISCKINEGSLKLIVKDNGKGYENTNSSLSSSLGIELVTEMVEQLNGTMQINSTNGTENIIEIPI